MKRISIVLSMGLLLSLLTCASVWAQVTAQISGSVQDQTGALLPGAEITVTQIETGVTRTTITNENGYYVLPNLALGPYRLEAGLPGFRTFVQTGIVLQVGSNPLLNVTLQVGEVSEQVEVQANAALVETQVAGVGQLIENQRILELPLNGRVATDLIVLAGATTPVGVSSIASYPGTAFFSVNGGTANGTGFWLDGSTYTNPYDSSNLPFPFPDALQEFKVESSALTAQNGLHAGATITAVVKSGTNSFHGDAFEFLRNSSLNAAHFLSHLKDPLKRNQFGGTIGGPLRKDKLFFFAGYQGTLNRQTPVATSSFVPTLAMIRGDFSACPTAIPAAIRSQFPNNQIDPGLFDPAALKLASKLPATADPCGRTSFGLVNQTNEHQVVSRADYQFSPRNSIFGRYFISKFDKPPSNAFDTNVLATTQPGLDDTSQNYIIGNTFLASPNLVSQARISVNRLNIRTFNGDFVSACDLGVPVYCGYTPHQSAFSVTGSFSVGGGTAAWQTVKETIYQINDDLSWSHGSHQVNFGGGAYMYKFGVIGNTFSTTSWTFPSIPQFLLGQFSSNALALPNAIYQYKKFVNGYVQDTWKLSRKLTLNAGVRWEPFLPPVQYNGAVYNFDIAKMIAGVKTTRYRNAPPA